MNSGPGPFAFTTVHGHEIQLYGRGLYFYDWAFKAPILLVLNATVGLVVIAQTFAQRMEGIVLSVQVMVVFVGIFVVTSLFATGLAIRYFRALADSPETAAG